jgi:multidrug efflux pump subunit AcrB
VQAFGFAIIMVFLILAAQYEKWSLPLAVIMAVPFALLGALTARLAARHAQRHLLPDRPVVLIGLASKNAILIVEFAAQKYAEGMSVVDAALEAARLRFRPIVMTSLAFVLGVCPLVKASRRRRRRPPVDGHRRLWRHARRHLHRHHLHSALLHSAAR